MAARSRQYPLPVRTILRRRHVPNAALMTWDRLALMIQEGFGQGHFEDYRPWLRVTKAQHSSVSRTGHLPAPELKRLHHFLSIAERKTILVLKFLGVVDAREQYPAWPWTHDHPACGLSGFGRGELVPGLLEIAAAAGIEHGVYVGTGIPYVATLDVVGTWKRRAGGYKLTSYECKPFEILQKIDPLDRVKERLELTRRYTLRAEIPNYLVHAERLPLQFVKNLDALLPRYSKAIVAQRRGSTAYKMLVEEFDQHGRQDPASTLVRRLAKRIGVTVHQMFEALHLGIWLQEIDHDLEKPLEFWRPLVPGGRKLKQRYFNEWGGID